MLQILRPKPRPKPRPVKNLSDETALQIALVELLTWNARPGWTWNHSPNEGKRSPRVGKELKAKGMRPGWPDLDLISPEGIWHGLEIKTLTGVFTPEQQAFGRHADAVGLRYRVARGWDNCVICLKEWGVLR